jgi:hypothetical protein
MITNPVAGDEPGSRRGQELANIRGPSPHEQNQAGDRTAFTVRLLAAARPKRLIPDDGATGDQADSLGPS